MTAEKWTTGGDLIGTSRAAGGIALRKARKASTQYNAAGTRKMGGKTAPHDLKGSKASQR